MRTKRFTAHESDYEIEELMADLEDDEDDLEYSFCPTGPGGGVDPSCSPGRESSQEDLKAKVSEMQLKLADLYKHAEQIKALAAKERANSPKGVASSTTKKMRSAINKKIDSLKQDIVGLHKQLEKKLEEVPVPPKEHTPVPAPQPSPEPTPPPGVTFEGKHTDPPVFANKWAAENWLHDQYKLTLQTEGKVTDERATALAQVSGQHLAHMSNNFELLDRYRTDPEKMGQPGGYGGSGTLPYLGSGNYRITASAFKNSGTGGDYNPQTGTIRMKDDLKIYGTTYAPKIGDHNVDFSYAGCFRHEYGHRIWGLALENKDRNEFKQMYEKYSKNKEGKDVAGLVSLKGTALGEKAVSIYGMTNVREFWAESFCAVTSPAYGSNGKHLPDDLEKFMHKTLGKREVALDYEIMATDAVTGRVLPLGDVIYEGLQELGVALSFCPTGPGGGVDPHCSPGAGGGREQTTAVDEHQINVWKSAMAVQKTNRDHAVKMIKDIKATGSTKGLSMWKKVRKEANEKIKGYQNSINNAYMGKVNYVPTPKAPVPESKPLPFYVPGSKTPIYAKSLEEAQKLYPKAKEWNDAKVTPGPPPPGVTLTPKSDNPPWVTDNRDPISGSGVRVLEHKEGNKEYKDWKESLSSEEQKGIHSYTGGGYHSLNEGFRKGIFSSVQLDRVHGIDSALAKSPGLKEPTLLYRKVGSSGETDKIYRSLKPGDVYVERGYASTAIEKDKWSGQYKLNILAPEGAKGAYVASISSSGAHEREFLLPRDSMFKVIRTRDESGYGAGKILDLELIIGKK